MTTIVLNLNINNTQRMFKMFDALLDMLNGIIYEHGYIKICTYRKLEARRNRFFGNVQFKRWGGDAQGRLKSWWDDMDSSWWSKFRKVK